MLLLLLLLFGLVPSLSFLFKSYAFSFLASAFLSHVSLSLVLVLMIMIYLAFTLNGLILRNFML